MRSAQAEAISTQIKDRVDCIDKIARVLVPAQYENGFPFRVCTGLEDRPPHLGAQAAQAAGDIAEMPGQGRLGSA